MTMHVCCECCAHGATIYLSNVRVFCISKTYATWNILKSLTFFWGLPTLHGNESNSPKNHHCQLWDLTHPPLTLKLHTWAVECYPRLVCAKAMPHIITWLRMRFKDLELFQLVPVRETWVWLGFFSAKVTLCPSLEDEICPRSGFLAGHNTSECLGYVASHYHLSASADGGMIRHIGDGSIVAIWADRWVPSITKMITSLQIWRNEHGVWHHWY
jgi:hypothetical protein